MLCHYAKCQYAEGRILFIVILNFAMLSVVMLNVFMLNVVMLSAEIYILFETQVFLMSSTMSHAKYILNICSSLFNYHILLNAVRTFIH